MTSPWQSPDPTELPPAPAVQPAQPRYGELAPTTQPQYGELAPNGQPVAYYATPQTARKVRTADVVVTSILLTIGLLVTVMTVGVTSVLPQSLASAYEQYGVTYHQSSNFGALAAFIDISHVVLFAAALGVSILLMVKSRVAFWVPLTAGVIATVIFWGVVIGMMVSDPALMAALQAANN
jgi:hypothetical protein